MQEFPSTPPIDQAEPAIFDEGHLWLLEHVDGAPLRFQLKSSGLIEFGTRNRTATEATELPAEYHHAAYHIEDRLQRDAIRAALDDPAAVTFLGIATQKRDIAYDWAELPSFLGVDVHTVDGESPYPPDVAHAIFEEIGLEPLNPIEREVRPRDFDADMDSFPASAWYDGPVAGVLVRNKRGGRALKRNDQAPTAGDPNPPTDANALAEELAGRIEHIVSAMASSNRSVTVERLAERLVASAWRTHHAVLSDSRDPIDRDTLREACFELARDHIEEIQGS